MASIAISNRPLTESILKLPIDSNNNFTKYCFVVTEGNAWQQSAIMELGARCIVVTSDFDIEQLCDVIQVTTLASGLIIAPMLNKSDGEKLKEVCKKNFIDICDSWKVTYKKGYLLNEENREDFQKAVTKYITGRSKPAEARAPTDGEIEAYNGLPLELTSDLKKIKKNINNIVVILENDKNLKDRFHINVLTKAPWLKCKPNQAPPWRANKGNYRPLDNMDFKFLLRYFAKTYGIESADKIRDMFYTVASNNEFNPIADLLNGLEWDGKPRINTMLHDYLGAEQNTYTAKIATLVCMGAVNRALTPGCKFDYVMILTGPQGNGKTTFCKRLALDDTLFNNSIAMLDGEKTARQIKGKWIIELGELLAVKRTKDVEAVKSFITQCADNYAPKYEELAEDFPRSCIFIGTTNSSSFLSDPTGNRRFLPVQTGRHQPTKSMWSKEANEDFRQIWAEAMEIYRSGNYSLVADKLLEEELQQQRANYEEENPHAVAIAYYLEEHTEINEVCSKQLFFEALENDRARPEKFTLQEARRINEIMHGLKGWKKSETKKKVKGCGSVYVYQRVYENIEAEELKKVSVYGNQTATETTTATFLQPEYERIASREGFTDNEELPF